jgi:RNA polymerase sigma factor (sigma-70 family)
MLEAEAQESRREVDLEALLRRLAAPLDRIRREKGLDLEAGRDALSEARLRFLRVDGPIAQPEGWILTAFRNECSRYVSKRKSSGERSFDFVEKQELLRPDPCPSGGVLLREIADRMEGLRPRDRALLEGRYLEGLSLAELAQRHGVKARSVKNLLGRATRRLRRLLDSNG